MEIARHFETFATKFLMYYGNPIYQGVFGKNVKFDFYFLNFKISSRLRYVYNRSTPKFPQITWPFLAHNRIKI